MQDEKEKNDSQEEDSLENFEQFAKKLFAVPYSEIKDQILKEEEKDPEDLQEPEEPEESS